MSGKYPKDGMPTIGLALGGGGARGFAHLGVLQVFEAVGLPIEAIAGTSMGALIGALYAQTGSAQAAARKLQRVLKTQERGLRLLNLYQTDRKSDHFLDYVSEKIQQRIIINLSIARRSLLSSKRIEAAIAELLDDCDIENLDFKLAVVASDLVSGQGVVLRQGSLRRAVVASASIPGFFPPVKWDDRLLVDGEVTNLVPVEACRALGADFVIAVDVTPPIEAGKPLRHTIDVLLRSARITNRCLAETALQKADYILRPVRYSVPWSAFGQVSELLACGQRAAKQFLPDLLAEIQSARRPDPEPKGVIR